jgi:hypothetical protein
MNFLIYTIYNINHIVHIFMLNQLANFATGVGQYDITLFNGLTMDASFGSGSGGGDLSFNASLMQYAQFTHIFSTSSATTGNGISFSGWFYPSGGEQLVGSALFHIIGDTTTVSVYYNTPTTLAGHYNGVDVVSTYELTPNMWHFFTYTVFCTSTQTALQTLYVDNPSVNAPIRQQTADYVAFSSTGNNYLGYGGSNGSNDVSYQYFNGKLDEFRWYNRVLTPSEISVLYQFNDRSAGISALTTSAITIATTGNNGYNTAAQIYLTGVFSGLNVTRTPAFPAIAYGTTGTTTANNVWTMTAKELVSVDGIAWYFLDTSVGQNTTYSYTITPYILNVTAASSLTVSGINTNSLLNGSFTTSSSLPTPTNYSTAPTLAGWTMTLSDPSSQYYLCNGTGVNVGINRYTNTLPSTISYYVSLLVSPASSGMTMSQNINLYGETQPQNTLRFYAWMTDDVSSSSSSLALTVSIGGWVILNSYTFEVGTGIPFVSFSLPCNISTPGTYPITFAVTNVGGGNNNGGTICIGGIQWSIRSMAGDSFAAIDPSMLQLYYPMDDVSGTGRLYNYATGVAVTDASLVNANIQTYAPLPLMGTGYLYTNGQSNSYAQLGNWTCPPNTTSTGFSIAGWMYPTVLEMSGLDPSSSTMVTTASTVYSLSNMSGGCISLRMKQINSGVGLNSGITTTTQLDFSCNGIRCPEVELSGNYISQGKWAFVTMTCAVRSDGSGN